MESPKINTDELTLLEELFRENLRESPIDIEKYRKLSSGDETLKVTFDEMLKYCLEYTEDVAVMERYAREHIGEYDEERNELDLKRGKKHDATISAINSFARALNNKGITFNWLKWSSQDRASYGNFAILTTLNRFKDEIILKKVIEKHEVDIDFDSMKKTADATELLVIRYVELLTSILKDDNLSEDVLDEAGPDSRFDELQKIKKELGRSEDEILGAFHRIYLKRYS